MSSIKTEEFKIEVTGGNVYAKKWTPEHLLSDIPIILLHDSLKEGQGFTKWEVKKFLKGEIEGNPKYETLTFPFSAGLTLIKKVK